MAKKEPTDIIITTATTTPKQLSTRIPNPFITLAGIIGAGKTTLATNLAKATNLPLYHENVVENQRLLDLFYEDRKKNGFHLQIELIVQRYIQQQLITWFENGGIQDRSIYEDMVFISMLVKEGSMTPLQRDTYMNLFNILSRFMRQPDVIIYLSVGPQIAFERIKKRGRECEKDITLEYLENLKEEYDAFIENIQNHIPVVIINWNEFKSNDFIIEKLNEKLEKITGKLFDWMTNKDNK